MPTGYTEKLMSKGQTFHGFAMRCARAMGACIMMRDDPLDAPIPARFEPSSLYAEQVENSKRKLERLRAMNDEEKIAFAKDAKARAVRVARDHLRKVMRENARLAAMRAKVEAWEPPLDHQKLKEFMLVQIKISMHDTSYCEEQLSVLMQTSPVEFFSKAMANAEWELAFSVKAHHEEIQRTESRNRWLQSLRESLRSKSARQTRRSKQ
jgi:hypothetical protein